MRAHAGQVSFPGGTVEEEDGDDVFCTAMRETMEELGLLSQEGPENRLTPLSLYHQVLSSSSVSGTPS